NVAIHLYRKADADVSQAASLAALTAYADAMRGELGRDIVRSQFVDAAFAPGVYHAEVLEPSEDMVLTRKQWADCTGVTVTVRGRADE
ncbi:MAG: baseplate protein, partial [Desulfovibrio sp.]|nr:baseplate protein [Desulfovibrio sp.]